ncbi:MAG: hypothetical protein ACE5ID_12375 [Acidobacteriota bacterium]
MRRSSWITLAFLAALGAALLYTSLRSGRIECEVCMSYQGRLRCARALAPTESEAKQSATTTACATLTSGRAQSMECSRILPARLSCAQEGRLSGSSPEDGSRP